MTVEQSTSRNVWRWSVSIVASTCLVGMFPLIALIVARLLHLDDTRTLVVLEAAMPVMLFAAYPVFVLAAMTRRRLLGVVSAFVVLSHVFFFAAEWKLPSDLPDAAESAPRFTLLTHNVLFDNPTVSELTKEIKQYNTDVVFLQEFTFEIYEQMKAEGAFSDYPYTSVNNRTGPSGLGIFSKFPLRNTQFIPSPGFTQQRTIIKVHGRDVVAWNVHLQSPIVDPFSGWQGDLEQLRDRTQAEKGDVLVAGDFNATWAHRPFRQLVTNGFRDVAMDRGRGWTRTWPTDTRVSSKIGGYIRIDHILTRNRLRPVNIKEGPGNGSDHRSLRSELVLLP